MKTLYNLIKNSEKINLKNSNFIITNKKLLSNYNNIKILRQTGFNKKLKLLNHMIYIVKLKNSAICLGTFTTKKDYITQCGNIVELKNKTNLSSISGLHNKVYYIKDVETTKWKNLEIKELPIEIINENFICHIKEMSKKFKLINVDTFQIETDITVISDFVTTTIGNI